MPPKFTNGMFEAKKIIIKNSFTEKNFTVSDIIHTENNNYIIFYVCPVGHKHKVSWGDWLYNCRTARGYVCPVCSEENKLFSVKYMVNNEPGFICLDVFYKFNDFQNRNELWIKFECTNSMCGDNHTHQMSCSDWKKGRRCLSCAYEKTALRLGNLTGDKAINWKGGISKLPYCPNWTKEYKSEIKDRDDYMCLNPYCFGSDDRLVVHHVDYTKTLCGPDNLITLCGSCNSRANTDREWHTQWYRIILNKRYNCEY